MRTIGTIILLITAFLAINYYSGKRAATKEQLEGVRVELRDSISIVSRKTDRNYKAIDSLREELAELRKQLENIENNQDSLKKGQILIYGAIKQREDQPRETEQSWYDKLSEFFTPKTFRK